MRMKTLSLKWMLALTMLLLPFTGMAFDSHGEPTWYDYRDTSWNPNLSQTGHRIEVSTPEQLA